MNQLKQLEKYLGVALTNRDRKALAPILSGYNHMTNTFARVDVSIPNIKKLIVLEMEGRKRLYLVTKLVGRLKSKERRQLYNYIDQCVNAPLNNKLSGTASSADASATSSPLPANGESRTE